MITKNFSLEELISSPTAIKKGIKNTPSTQVINCLTLLCENILQPVRDKFGEVHIDSAYRCPKLNVSVGGAATSQHVFGQAADIVLPDMKTVFKWIQDTLPFDQLIWENGDSNQPKWIHVSYSSRNRKEILRKKSGETKYTKFRVD
jgi:zinc D-Ala-D-Ala carboxypeptidase